MSEQATEETTDAVVSGDHARVDDAPSRAADTSMAVAVIPKQRIVATSNVAIWDTAALDHMGRVGAIMASSKLASPTIYDGVDGPGAVARMVMIANLARECGANPLMFLQGCSIISNKLHLEGKIVAAIITARTGIRLRYRFGVWKDGGIVFPETQQDGDFFKGAGENLAVRVEDPEDADRFVDGFVGLWKTDRKGSPWSAPANWRRQLRYRGAPEWARAYEPGAVLGFYSDADEDLEEFEAPKPRTKRDLAAKLTNGKSSEGPQEGDQGFNRAGVAEALGDGAGAAPAASGEAMECDHEFEGEGDDAACKHCGQLEADATEAKAEPEPAKEPTGPVAIEGPAPAGETYLMFGDAYVKDRRLTYKDGARFSSVGPQGAAKLKAYTEHAPEIVAGEHVTEETTAQADETDGLDQPCEACGAGPGEACAEDCPALAEEAGEGAGAAVEPEAETEAEPETGFLATLTPMKSWADEFKPACTALFKTSDYQSASDAEKNELRAAIWAKVIAKGIKVDQADDPSAYGLWLAWIGNTRDDADAVEGTFNTLQRSERWEKMTPASRKPLEDRTAAKLASIRGGNG